jgi:hypothetical protein
MKSLTNYFQLPCKSCLVKPICKDGIDKCSIIEQYRRISLIISAWLSSVITCIISISFLILIFKFCGIITFCIVLILWVIIGFILGLLILSDTDANKKSDVIFILLLLTILGIPIVIFLSLNQFLMENLFD